jgi:hypothetical protein
MVGQCCGQRSKCRWIKAVQMMGRMDLLMLMLLLLLLLMMVVN